MSSDEPIMTDSATPTWEGHISFLENLSRDLTAMCDVVTSMHIEWAITELTRLRDENREYAKADLLQRMFNACVELFHISWRKNWDFWLWKASLNPGVTVKAGAGEFDAEDDEYIKAAEKAGGWWSIDDDGEAQLVPLSVWRPLYEAWEKEQKGNQS